MSDIKEEKKQVVDQPKGEAIKEGAKVDVDTLRFMSLEQLAQMEAYIVKANKEAFDLYFTIQRVRNNKMVIKKEAPSKSDAEKSE